MGTRDEQLLYRALLLISRLLPAHRYKDEQKLIDDIRARLAQEETA